jgi:hypothetical protein
VGRGAEGVGSVIGWRTATECTALFGGANGFAKRALLRAERRERAAPPSRPPIEDFFGVRRYQFAGELGSAGSAGFAPPMIFLGAAGAFASVFFSTAFSISSSGRNSASYL